MRLPILVAATLLLLNGVAQAMPPGLSVAPGAPLGLQPTTLTLDEVDGDRQVDLLAGDDFSSWLVRDALTTRAAIVGARLPARSILADVDGDGREEVVSLGGSPTRLRVLRPGRTTSQLQVPRGAEDLLAGDVDGDGRTDVVLVMGYQAAIGPGLVVALGDGVGGFSVQPEQPTLHGLVALGGADLDGDGRLDVLGSIGDGESVFLFRGGAPGGFSARRVSSACPTSGPAAVGDLVPGGGPELVLACRGRLQVFEGDGARGLRLLSSTARLRDVYGLAVGDVDGDARADVVATTSDEVEGADDELIPDDRAISVDRVDVLRGDGGGGLRKESVDAGDGTTAVATAGTFGGHPEIVLGTHQGLAVAHVSSRPMSIVPFAHVAHGTGRVDPAEDEAVVRVDCRGATGRCTGSAELSRLGLTLSDDPAVGRARFSIRAGLSENAHIELRPARLLATAFRAHVRVILRTAHGVASTPAVLRGGDRRARHVACARPGRSIAHDAVGRLYQVQDTVFGCTYARGRRIRAGFGPVAALVGPYAAVQDVTDGDGISGGDNAVSVHDLRHPRRGASSDTAPEHRCPRGLCANPQTLASLVVGRAGATAYISCFDGDELCGRAHGGIDVIVFDRRGLTRVDHAGSIRPRSLRVSRDGRTVSWRHGAHVRRARLHGTPLP